MPPSSFLYVLRRLLTGAHGRGLHAKATAAASAFTALFLLASSLVIVPVERGAPQATITTYPRALWWSIETATTVGYGDTYPVTAWGRVIAAFVMLVGIATFSIVTAAIATWFVNNAARDARRLAADAGRLGQSGEREAEEAFRALHDRFDRLEHALTNSTAPGTQDGPGRRQGRGAPGDDRRGDTGREGT
ncbi:potassium channel family protein [Streptomyces sp. NPDC050560]|uniref:potassium channel family protein n=1 Tax=Streptomyces sp. NPDC050560 TaxID=3365630 RepID=UPI00379C223A